MRSEQYQRRLAAPEWQALRRRLLRQAGYRCQRCHRGECVLQLHHKTYDRLGQELDEDFEVLCVPCHAEADKERANATAGRQYAARLDGWATKVYGEDWEDRVDPNRVEEHFESWLDAHEDDY